MRRINLIPEEKRKELGLKRLFLYKNLPPSITITLIIFLLITSFQFIDILRLKFYISAEKKEIVLKESELEKNENIYRQIKSQQEELLRKKKRIEEKISAINQIKESSFIWSIILQEISRIMPSNVWLKGVSLNKDAIVISGSASDNLVVSKFMQALDDSDSFKDTNFSYTRKERIKKDKIDEYYEMIDFGLTTYLSYH